MARIEARIARLRLVFPEPLQVPAGLKIPFEWMRVRGHRAYVSGQVPVHPDGRLAEPLGRVGAEVTPEQAYVSARLVALDHQGSLKRVQGDLDRITAWLRVFTMANVSSGFSETPRATNGYSDLILEVFGPEVGAHARWVIGMVIPLNAPANCEAELEIDGDG